jgi:hypothetical protein
MTLNFFAMYKVIDDFAQQADDAGEDMLADEFREALDLLWDRLTASQRSEVDTRVV